MVRLAESLALSLRERNALLLTAGYAPAYQESPRDGAAIEPAMTALRSLLTGHLPYPAVVAGPRGELVLANDAFEMLTEGAAARLLEPPVNVLRLALHPEGMGQRVVNLAAWGRHVTESLRARAAAHPDGGLDALAAEPAGYLPAGAPPGPDHLGFAVPLRLRTAGGELRLLTTLTSFATAVDVTLAELRLEAFLPADRDRGAAAPPRGGPGRGRSRLTRPGSGAGVSRRPGGRGPRRSG
ncbi:MmyB family transcriptional regulator [Streptomyces sp. MJM1172]|uniref:MmyB family transcriptional regulator n=1 Tax=Streptomyces sp. MJM1172 TaxID=1703926 RepID=UPI000AFF3DA8